jgi:hypothetical protein
MKNVPYLGSYCRYLNFIRPGTALITSIPCKRETPLTEMNPLNTSFKQSSRMLLSYSACNNVHPPVAEQHL